MAADGITPIANSTYGGSGILSIDHVPDVIVGGPQPTAINVFGESLGHGIAPHEANRLLIEGNYIGLAYDGTTILGNTNSGFGSGIALSSSNDVTIKNNRIAGWKNNGVSINADNNVVNIEDNIVHDNVGVNISVGFGCTNITIKSNTVYRATQVNIGIAGFSAFIGTPDHVVVQSNKIGYLPDGSPSNGETSIGINVWGDPTNVLIGGTNMGEGNLIHGQKASGIGISTFTVQAFEASIHPNKVSVLGNSITATEPNQFSSYGLGIDLHQSIDTDPSPDGTPNTFNNVGPNVNDSSDVDTGANNYINFPVLNSASQEGEEAAINFNIDASDSPTDQYRVEFFANDTPDTSGFGEGQTYLGSITVTNGNDQTATITLPSNFKLSGKSISATTTAVDSTTDSGFGSTSEFSVVLNLPDDITAADSELPGTGENVVIWVLAGVIFATIGFVRIFRSTIKA